MNSSNLFQTIKVLLPADKKELTAFLKTPFFKNKKEVIDLWNFIEPRLSGRKDELSKADAFAAIFPGKSYNDQKMRQVMSRLLKAIEQMVSVSKFLKNSNEQKLHLLSFYRENGLEVQFNKHLRAMKSEMAGTQLLSVEELRLIPEIEFENYRFKESRKRDLSMNLQEVTDAFDVAFIANKLRLACLINAHNSLFKTAYKIEFLEVIVAHLEVNEKQLHDNPIIELYFLYHKSTTEAEFKTYWKKFRNLLSKNLEFLPESAQTEFLIYSLNFCIRKYNLGDVDFLEEVFSIYKEGLEKAVLIKSGNIGRFTFKNIVTTALKLNEFDWATDFIESYSPKLKAAHRKDFENFCTAHLAYSVKDYAKAMKRLNAVNPKDLFMAIGAKLMFLKIYVEKGEFDAVHASIASLKKFLQRKQIVAYHRENYLKIISFIEKLIALNRFDRKAIQELKKDISENAPMPERAWLLAQTNG